MPVGYASSKVSEIAPDVRKQINSIATSNKWPLTLWGGVGTGKTSAAACLYGKFPRLPMWHRADELLLSMSLGRVSGVEIDSWSEYGELVRRTIPYGRFVERVKNTSCLFLDDLGTRPPTEAMYAALFDVLEYRKDRPLVITTNLSGEQILGAYDTRIVDRLRVGTVIHFSGTSRRK